jgi:hypothetical protein
VAALVGAGIAGVVALAAQVLGGLMSARSRRREARSSRLTEYLAGTYGGVLAIGQVARAPRERKTELEREVVWPYMDRSNTALTAIELHDAADLVAAIQAFDAAVVELVGWARDREYDRPAWRDQRHAVLDEHLARVKHVGRQHVRGTALEWARWRR